MRMLAEQPVSIGKVLDISLKLYSASFKLFLPYCGLLTLFYIAIGFISQSLQHGSDVEKGLLLLLLGLMLLVMAVFFFILYAAMVYRVDNFIHERDDSMMDSLLFGLKKVFPCALDGYSLWLSRHVRHDFTVYTGHDYRLIDVFIFKRHCRRK
ncbi:hypothetical protein [Methylocucumis oryzae]|uniref:Uncharacterized protein n=1 Tax=Methylocucumis oryzae TaxID=1632867 RepID=A0A0F3IIB7_9GAMM|nr:hypothetical protein [Methylocucumis oryzae]KJV06412.1 hypothetical protein VZ94_11370 [Methylocucumis oryzae]